jgi:hypothetical protein
MINNPVYQRQNFYFHNNGNPFYQHHPYHQHYRQNPNHHMYYHALPNFHQQNLNYQQNYYNYSNRQLYPPFNSNNNMFWNNQNYSYQYSYQFEPIQTHYSVYQLIANNQVKPNTNLNFNSNLNIKKNRNEIQSNKPVSISMNKTQIRLTKSNSDDKQIKNQNNQKKINKSTTTPTSTVKKESNEEITDFILKNIEDTTVIKIGDKYQEPSNKSNFFSNRSELEYKKSSKHELMDSLTSSSSINFNDLETSSEVFRQEGNDSTTIVNHIEIKLENSFDQKPKSTKSLFNSTMEELKSNYLFLAQQKKVEEYELYEEEKKQEMQELHIKLKKEYKKNNFGERSNINNKYRLFNHVKEEGSYGKESCSSEINKINAVNNDGKLKFKINDELMNCNLGKIKFLGVYKADPENYFKNLSQKNRETVYTILT